MAALSEKEVCQEIERDLNRLLLSSINQDRPPDVAAQHDDRPPPMSQPQPSAQNLPPVNVLCGVPFPLTANNDEVDCRPRPTQLRQKPGKRDRRKNDPAPKPDFRPVENNDLRVVPPVEVIEASVLTPFVQLMDCNLEGDGCSLARGLLNTCSGVPAKDEGHAQSKARSVTGGGRMSPVPKNSRKGPRRTSEGPLSGQPPSKGSQILFLQDLERYLLQSQSMPPEKHRHAVPSMPFGPLSTNQFDGYNASNDKLDLFKQHRVLPLKRRSRRFPRAHFYCHLCHRHFDDVWYVEKHLDQDQHVSKKLVSDMRVAIKNLPYPVDVQCDAIGAVIEKIVEEHSLSAEEVELRKRMAADLEAYIRETLPDVRFHLHGSSVNGFGLKTSNVNLDLSPAGKADCAQLFVSTGDLLQGCPKYEQVTKNYLSKVPRIRFREVSSKLSCEISLNNCNSQKTSRLLDDYASLDPRVKTLGVTFRLWAKYCGLDQQDRGTLPAHAFAIMTVFFLQQCKPAVLPVLHEMKGAKESESYLKPKDLEGQWSCKNDRSVGQLWVELLRFYAAEFKLNKRVVCVRRSQPLLIAEKKWNRRYIAIEDPYSSKRNLARSIPSERVYLFIKRCLCTSAIYFLQPQLNTGPLFTRLPGPPMYTENSDSDSDTDHEEPSTKQRKMRHDSDDLGRAKVTDEDEDEDEDEDDASSCSSGPAHDSDEHDPELSFTDVSRVIANLDLGPEPTTKAKGPRKKEAQPQDTPPPPPPLPPSPPAVQLFVKPGPPLPQRYLDELDFCSVGDFCYNFSRKTLANGKSPPIICSFCQKSGHLHEDCPDQRLPELKQLPDMTRNYTKILNDLCQDVMNECSPKPDEEANRQEVLQQLESFIQELYKDAKLTLYGSSCNGFGLVRSDLDICLTFESSKDGKDLCHSKMIKALARKLHKHPDLNGIIAIATAKVPIVKFYHIPSGLEGDISLYNTLAQHNTRLLKAYSEIDHRVRVLGYTFKHFAKTCDIGDASRGSLSSYAYILMTLHYLQQCKPPVIPVLQELFPEGETKPEVVIEGWNAWFFGDIDRLQDVWSEFGQNNESVGELWLGMLKFYTEEFNFQEHVVSIRQRAPVTRLQKMWTSQCIAIEDPFDLDHNLGSGVSRKMNTYIMKAFIKGRALFGTPIRKFPPESSTAMEYFFDRQQLTDGDPPNDRGCRSCGKIGHRAKDCPCPKKKNGDGDEKNAAAALDRQDRKRDRGNRTQWQMPDARSGPRNRQAQFQQLSQMNQQQRRARGGPAYQPRGHSMMDEQQHHGRGRASDDQQRHTRGRMMDDQQRHAGGHALDEQQRHVRDDQQHHVRERMLDDQQRNVRDRVLDDQQRHSRNRVSDDQLHPPQHPHQPQQQQNAPSESLPPEAPPPSHGVAPPGVAQAQLQRALQDMMGAGLQMGPAPRCFAPPMGVPPTAFMAPPPLRPPPFPGANGQTPPHPDVQALLFKLQQQQPGQAPQDMGRYGQWQPIGPPPRHTISSSWPPGLPPPPHGQEPPPLASGSFIGPRPVPPHSIPHHPQVMPPLPQQAPFLCGPPPSKPPFAAMPPLGQPVFPGALPTSDVPPQQWDGDQPSHEMKPVPSQD